MSAEHAISSISLQRIKVTRVSEANDPFELLALNCMRRDLRRSLSGFRTAQADRMGMLCFSDEWKSPVLWSHYADGHKGICLGFDIDPTLGLRGVQQVRYEDKKLQALEDSQYAGEIPEDLQELLLVTKFRHWQYEQELRVFVNLSKMQKETSLHFHPFSDALCLREVVLGHLCPNSLLRPIRQLVRAMSPGALVSKARLGFKHFEVKTDARYPAAE